MKLDERLINEKRELEKKNNNKQIRVLQEEDETGMAYMPRPASRYINSGYSVFDNVDETSINTTKSVFDRTAIFTVGR